MSELTFPALKSLDSHPDIPLQGRIFTFGSSRNCSLVLPRGQPERMGHLLFANGQYEVQSLQGAGIRLNGKTLVGSAPLGHGDRLEMAGRRYRYLERAEADTGAGEGDEPVWELIEIIAGLMRDRRPDVFPRLVNSVSRLLKSDAARLVGEDPLTGELRTLARYPQDTGLERFSNRAIEWAREADRTVMMQEADWSAEGEDPAGSKASLTSLEKNFITSVLCTPLAEQGEILGFLYLDRMRREHPFTEKDRRFCDLLKPLFEEILLQRKELARQKETIARLQEGRPGDASLIYASKGMAELMDLAARVAGTDSSVLISGETGTGKELLARFIHTRSRRAERTFLAVNCGAIPENLMESELFGYEKGAFTGAAQQKRGLFEAADGGTLFLDEIGELSLPLQVKLLRVLQEGTLMRVGGSESVPVNVRIISATHRDLAREVKEGRFRQDMYFRLNVLNLKLPALREREEDVLLLADYLVKKYCQQFGLPMKALAASARKEILLYAWPGNIRELENAIQKAILLSPSRLISAQDLNLRQSPFAEPGSAPGALPSLKEARAAAEKEAISAALRRCRGNISQASRMLQIDRKWLMKLMQELEIEADEFRD